MRFTLLLLIVSSLFFLGSCCEPVRHSIDSLEDIRAVTFENGSYWVYKDSVTNERDSVWVRAHGSQSLNTNLAKRKCQKEYKQYILTRLNSSLNNANNLIISGIAGNDGSMFLSCHLKDMVLTDIPYTNFYEGQLVSEPYHLVGVKEYGTLNILGNDYYDVRHYYSIVAGTVDTFRNNVYYSANDGIVKYTTGTGVNYRCFELERNLIKR